MTAATTSFGEIPRHTVPLAILALLCALALLENMLSPPGQNARIRVNLTIATALAETGTFTDQLVVAPAIAEPSRALPPGYPAVVAGLTALDPGMLDAVKCFAESAKCPLSSDMRTLVFLQTLLVVGIFLLIFAIALDVSGSWVVATLATVLTFGASSLVEFAGLYLPIVWISAFQLTGCAALLMAWRRDSLAWLAIAGAAFGTVGLFDTAGLGACLLTGGLVLAVWMIARRASLQRSLIATLVFASGALLVLAPWQVRNFVTFGDSGIAPQQTTQVLARRVSYNAMTAGDYASALIAWFPGIGVDVGWMMFDASTMSRLDTYEDGSYLSTARAIAPTDTRSHVSHWRQIFESHVLGQPVAYVLTTVPLLIRGLGSTGGFVVLWGLVLLPLLWRRLRATNNLAPAVLAFGPLVLMGVWQGLTGPNFGYDNTALIALYAYAVAHVAGGIEIPMRWQARAGLTP